MAAAGTHCSPSCLVSPSRHSGEHDGPGHDSDATLHLHTVMHVVTSALKSLRDRLMAGFARRSDLDDLYRLIHGLIQIQNAMEGRPVVRPLREWAVSPDAMVWILAALQERERPTVAEFGCGRSTLILAASLRHLGGRLISIEHSSTHLEETRQQLVVQSLAAHVEFVLAPIVPASFSGDAPSYDLSAVPDVTVDIAFVDGPPAFDGNLSRLTPLRWALSHLSEGGVVFLDDASMAGERACVAKVLSDYPDVAHDLLPCEKGLARLRPSVRRPVSPNATPAER